MSVRYESYSYLFPPRPIQTTKHTELGKYDNGQFIAAPKYNGDCSNVFISEKEVIVMNRHKEKMKGDYSKVDFRGMYDGLGCKGWLVISGEFLNKSKKGEDGKLFNLKFIIWDILVYNGDYMIGSTFGYRVELLEKLFPSTKMMVKKDKKMEMYKHLCCTMYNDIYKAPAYYSGFEKLYNDIVNTDIYEGVLLKRIDGKLSYGLNTNNNNSWQIKCRKETKNYQF